MPVKVRIQLWQSGAQYILRPFLCLQGQTRQEILIVVPERADLPADIFQALFVNLLLDDDVTLRLKQAAVIKTLGQLDVQPSHQQLLLIGQAVICR